MGGERAEAAERERLHFLVLEEAASTGKVVSAAIREPGLVAVVSSGRAAPLRGAGLRMLPQAVLGELARDGARGGAFLCLPVLLGLGAVIYYALPWEPEFPFLFALAAPLLLAVWLLQSRPAGLVCCGAVLAITAGVGAAKIETWRAATPVLGSDVTTRITGRVAGIEYQASGRIRLIIDIVTTERPRLRYAPERVRLTARGVPAGLRPGDGVTGLVRLMSPSGPVRPGSYDFSFASYYSGIGAIGFFMKGPERAEIAGEAPFTARLNRTLETVRLALAERIRSQIDGSKGEVAVAVITGYRSGIPEEVNEWLRRSGLAHILSISGLHMALVAVTVMFMLRAGSALFPGFSSRVPVKKYAAAAALAFCTLYLFISGAEVAAKRSYIMLAVMLAALIFDRAALTMRNVAIAALIIIALSPHEVVGPSFQMSFAATAALIAGYAVWSGRRSGRASAAPPNGSLVHRAGRMALGFVIGLAATSLIAGTATALYGIWHFQRATPLALPANLAAMPFVSTIAMPAAVLAMVAMPFGLDGFFLKIMAHAIAAVIAVAKWFSDRTPIDAVGLIPLPALLALTAALVILVISTTRLRLLALPFLAIGIGLLMTRELPDIFISEDARLVGVGGEGGVIAVNRNRPNGFTMEDWTRSLNAERVLKPVTAGAPVGGLPGNAFSCGDGLCVAQHQSGAVIAHAESPEVARIACATATLIVIDDATAGNPCGANRAVVITKRELARRGSAVVDIRRGEAALRADITFAIEEPYRPWHAHRTWSRAARGLPPYTRRKKEPRLEAPPPRASQTRLLSVTGRE
ncbi:ComEC/Rec2 family competence protein [Chelativorans sp. AA-79]|uniref:ComEC/Rec2 family competence protein n=1 Tax=Chelativorans sp. AA-79 TaxID=3028735 RepID=UPI0023F780FA|nr:ComEC/Rec2 family competence protein [Chelativorans sp. AA-79]WEX07143.1 ComEC/Rec2 family competence protein [Chelativorans sp. AA-79]